MADKTLSTPQRSEGPFHACPGGRGVLLGGGCWELVASWFLAPVQPNAISTAARFELPALRRHRGQGLCDTCEHTHC
ncbi:hypothetical protein CgunFtcFv8_005460 [Champsocephalus gunnari]|uniref:Uncharacterized protein n=1 Tax=Champsocephalus gunnari TaxID=52237 RepID=A0AAN8CVT9_CHAGU|nr:hypothetical protein CgunFtcFv8_005460 [Champsocephalus gunnari]